MSKINKKIINILKEHLSKIPSSKNGDDFDKEVYNLLANKLGIRKINHTLWSESTLVDKNYYKRSSNYNFDFSDLKPILGDKTFIVDKPNGKQKWPDMLLVNDGVGFPIEIKSCKSDKIVWNSGLPRPDSLYIFKLSGTNNYTFFLGQHAISEKEYNSIAGIGKHLSSFNTNIDEAGRWSFYVRNMHSSNQRFITIDDDEKAMAEQEAINLIENLTWDSKQATDFSYTQKHKVYVDLEFYTKVRRNSENQCCVEMTVKALPDNDAYEKRLVMVLGKSWEEVRNTLPDVDTVLDKAINEFKELNGSDIILKSIEGLEDFYEDKVFFYKDYIEDKKILNVVNK